MGSVCACGSSKKSSSDSLNDTKSQKPKLKNTPTIPDASEKNANIHSSKTVSDNNSKVSNSRIGPPTIPANNTTNQIDHEIPLVLKSGSTSSSRGAETTKNIHPSENTVDDSSKALNAAPMLGSSSNTDNNTRGTRTASGTSRTNLPPVFERTNDDKNESGLLNNTQNNSLSQENINNKPETQNTEDIKKTRARTNTASKNEPEITSAAELDKTETSNEPVTTATNISSQDKDDEKLENKNFEDANEKHTPNVATDEDKGKSRSNTKGSVGRPETTENINDNAEPRKDEGNTDEQSSVTTDDKDKRKTSVSKDTKSTDEPKPTTNINSSEDNTTNDTT